MSVFFRFLATVYFLYKGFKNRILRVLLRHKFRSCGKNVKFDVKSSNFTFDSISIGNDVYIGPHANFSASETFLTIGNKVLFGPNVTIMCGNHNTKVIGKYMFDINYKNENDDLSVTIENDVWIGANVVILKGVRIAEGSIIGAGSLVTKSTKPYSVNIGVPAKHYKDRWTNEELELHQKKIRIES